MKKILVLLAFAGAVSPCFAQDGGVDISRQTENILSATKNLLIKVADSEIDISDINLDDNTLLDRGILTSAELYEFRTITQGNGNKIKEQLSITTNEEQECEGCNASDGQKIEKLKMVITSIRDNKEEFILNFNKFTEDVKKASGSVSRLFGSNPHCSFAFYICLGVGSGATSGLGAAAAIYLCACGFCQTTPPGCSWR